MGSSPSLAPFSQLRRGRLDGCGTANNSRGKSSSYLHAHASRILLARSTLRAIAWLVCIVHRRKADIPVMLQAQPWSSRDSRPNLPLAVHSTHSSLKTCPLDPSDMAMWHIGGHAFDDRLLLPE